VRRRKPTRQQSKNCATREGSHEEAGLPFFVTVAVAIYATAWLNSTLRADDYPSRPLTMISVFGPAAPAITLCRNLADPLSKALGQPIASRPSWRRWRVAAAYGASPAGGRLHRCDGDQIPRFPPIRSCTGRLRRDEGLCAGHAGRQLHSDAGDQPQAAVPFGPGPRRLCQANPGQLSSPAATPPASCAAIRSPTGPGSN